MSMWFPPVVLTDDRVADASIHGGDRWRPFTHCLAACSCLYTTVSIRIVIQDYLPLLTRPEHIVHFFRDVHGVYPLTKDALAKRTQEYQQWVDAFARNRRIPNRVAGCAAAEDEEAEEGGLRPTVWCPDGAAAPVRRLLHLQEPGTGPDVWHPRPEVPDGRLACQLFVLTLARASARRSACDR